jgi:hypothetical protein
MVERNLLVQPLPAVINPSVLSLIPDGGYCHRVVKTMTQHGQVIRIYNCPFFYGTPPNGGCMLYGKNAYLEDAVKVCGIKKPSFTLNHLH